MSAVADAEVQHLADVIAEAKLSGVSAGCHTLARMILAAGYRRVDIAEGHIIEFRDTGWTLMHPLACRPNLFACAVNRVAEQDVTGLPLGAELGRFECGLVDGEIVIGERVETPEQPAANVDANLRALGSEGLTGGSDG